MSFTPQSNKDDAEFGFEPIDPNIAKLETQQPSQQLSSQDAEFGFEPLVKEAQAEPKAPTLLGSPLEFASNIKNQFSDSISGLDAEKDIQGLKDIFTTQGFEKPLEVAERELRGFNENVLSGLTLGGSDALNSQLDKFIPLPQKEEEEDKEEAIFGPVGKVVGSIAPISKGLQLGEAAVKPLAKLAAKSPFFSKSLQSLSNLIGTAVAGAGFKATEDIFKGEIPKAEDVLEHGAEWSFLEAVLGTLGIAGSKFISKLRKTAPEASKFEVINDFINENKKDFTSTERVASKVNEVLQEKPLEAKPKPIEKVKRESLDFVARDADLNAQEILPEEIIPSKVEKRIVNNAQEISLDEFSPRPRNFKDLGESVTKDIRKGQKEVADSVKPKYEKVKSESKKIFNSPQKAINLANEILEDINNVKTRPEGFKKVISTLETALEDIGVQILEMKGKGGKFVLRDSSGNALKNTSQVSLDKQIELSRRLNKVVNFDLEGPSVKNKLKPLIKELKDDTFDVLKKKNPAAAKLLKEADTEFAIGAEKFGRDNIRRLLKTESKENVKAFLESPTAIADLKDSISEKSFKEFEREVLENMRSMKIDKARKVLREIGNEISPEANKLAREIIENKVSPDKIVPSQRQKLKEDFLKGLSKDNIQGTRPDNALNLWKTRKGQEFIKDSLKDNPGKKKILKFLETQSLFDFAKTILSKEGKLDFKKLDTLLKDPGVKHNLELVGGKDTVKFFENIENLSKKYEKNLRIQAKIPVTKLPPPKTQRGKELLQKGARREAPLTFKLRDLLEGVSPEIKIASAALGFVAAGPVRSLIGVVGAKVARNQIVKMATRPKIRSDMLKGLKSKNVLDSLGYLEEAGIALKESEKE